MNIILGVEAKKKKEEKTKEYFHFRQVACIFVSGTCCKAKTAQIKRRLLTS